MMRATHLLVLLLCVRVLCAQVNLSKPVILSNADPSERRVEGLATAADNSALITVDDARAGRYHWAQASGTGAAIILQTQPACGAYTNGLELRFMPAASGAGRVSVDVDGLGVRYLYRTDGLNPGLGELVPGRIATMIYADTAFFLQDRPRAGCPPDFYDVNGQYCIQRNDTLYMSIFNANKWCSDRGARLCSWGEYIHACSVHQTAMEGMFNEWEWVDDTSDHTHTAVQVGRWSCYTQRAWTAVENPNNYANVRCCYTIR